MAKWVFQYMGLQSRISFTIDSFYHLYKIYSLCLDDCQVGLVLVKLAMALSFVFVAPARLLNIM